MNKTEQQKKWREANKEREAAKKKKWLQENKEKVKEYRAKYRAENKEKLREANKIYRLKNADKIKKYNKEQQKQYRLLSKEASYKSWLRNIYSACKNRYKRKNHIICEITLDDLIARYEEQNGLCTISKIKMEHKQSLNSISIDRKDNSIGYTKENIHLVVKWINIGRGTASLDEIKRVVQNLIETNR